MSTALLYNEINTIIKECNNHPIIMYFESLYICLFFILLCMTSLVNIGMVVMDRYNSMRNNLINNHENGVSQLKNEMQVQRVKKELMYNKQIKSPIISKELIASVQDIAKASVVNSKKILQKSNFEEKLEIVIRPDLQLRIEAGELTRDKGSLLIRDNETKRFVGKADLEMKLVEQDKELLSTLTNNIVAFVGQAQLAEISAKLDVISEKIDKLAEFEWNKTVSELNGLKNSIEEASISLPNEHARIRINNCITPLQQLSELFKKTIEDMLEEKIKFGLIPSFVEGLKVWEWSKVNRNEYNPKYTKDIQEFINKYGFLFELYSQSLGLLAVCYQVTNEIHHATKYIHLIEVETVKYTNELVSKLGYLLDVKDAKLLEGDSILNLKKQMTNRNIDNSLLDEVTHTNEKFIEAQELHETLISQFEQLAITIKVDAKDLLEAN